MSTLIPWTDETWNPVTGCTKTSPGCANCYIERTPPFRMAHRKFVNGTTGVQLHPERLDKPLHWRKPRRVFVCSLADLFHEDVPDEFIRDVVEVVAEAPQHVFQVLTKRPERMRDLFQAWDRVDDEFNGPDSKLWPLPNLWLGVTIENARYTYRADILREIPAAVRFISAEPLLGSLFPPLGFLDRARQRTEANGMPPRTDHGWPLDLTGIDWLIAGAESGPKARPMDEGWVRELRDACLGCATYASDGCDGSVDRSLCRDCDGAEGRPAFFFKQAIVNGRKVECPELDGRQWMEFPR
jgi:protein gp37